MRSCSIHYIDIEYPNRVQQWKWNTIQLENANKKKILILTIPFRLCPFKLFSKRFECIPYYSRAYVRKERTFFFHIECVSCFCASSSGLFKCLYLQFNTHLAVDNCKFFVSVLNIKWYLQYVCVCKHKSDISLLFSLYTLRRANFSKCVFPLSVVLNKEKRRFPFWLIIFLSSDMVLKEILNWW